MNLFSAELGEKLYNILQTESEELSVSRDKHFSK